LHAIPSLALDERTLETYLAFGDADLASNRAGDLSPGQRSRLLWSGIWRLVVGPPLVIGPIAVAAVFDLAPVHIALLLFASFGLYLTWHGFAFVMDSTANAVAFVTGPMRLSAVRGRYGYTYYARIGPVAKQITRTAYDSLPEGRSCNLYYAPGCRSLLAIEPASADEPKPAHPFGADSAHAWDRIRWSWVAITMGAVGLLMGAHAIVVAHPAHPVAVEGTMASYVERHGKSTTRTIYMAGVDGSFTPQSEGSYDPPVAPFADFIGRPVTLYVNEGTSDVIAFNDGEVVHTTDWYVHPEHQTIYMATNGAITAAISALAILGGVIGVVFGRRRIARTATEEPDAAWRPRYLPPTVHEPVAVWPAGLLVAAGAITTALALAAAAHR
jgi:hypothetical protein